MHMHHSIEQEQKGWRNNWFVKNVLAEIPIIGGFFHSANIGHALHNAGKSTAMLVGGTTGMMIDMMVEKNEMDSMALSMTKSTANMAAGMMTGNVIYNTLFSLGNTIYRKCNTQSTPSTSAPTESLNRPLIQIEHSTYNYDKQTLTKV